MRRSLVHSIMSVSCSLRSSGKVLVNASRCAADVLVNAFVHLRSICLCIDSTKLSGVCVPAPNWIGGGQNCGNKCITDGQSTSTAGVFQNV